MIDNRITDDIQLLEGSDLHMLIDYSSFIDGGVEVTVTNTQHNKQVCFEVDLCNLRKLGMELLTACDVLLDEEE